MHRPLVPFVLVILAMGSCRDDVDFGAFCVADPDCDSTYVCVDNTCLPAPGGGGEGEGEGEGEPAVDVDGNTRATPFGFFIPGTVTTDLAVGDTDCFALFIDTRLAVTIDTVTAGCGSSDTVLEAFDAAGSAIGGGPAVDDTPGAGLCSTFVATLDAGNYVVCVFEFSRDQEALGITLTGSTAPG